MWARALTLAAGAAIVSAAPAAADVNDLYTTTLLSRAADGSPGNAPAENVVISRNRRIANVVAFNSAASNLVADDANGVSDIFVVNRFYPGNPDGEPWNWSTIKLVSKAFNGGQANGPSKLAQLSGDSRNDPRCVAFVSSASNLVPGDTNNKQDGFVADLRTGKIRRVSVGSDGKQSNGTTYEIAVDGRCRRAVFTADATNLAMAKGRTPQARAMRTTGKEPRGSRQVYVHGLGGTAAIDRSLDGVTWVASRTPANKPSNGTATHPRMSDNSSVVVYDSTATTLIAGDTNGAPDVFHTTFTRKYLPRVKFKRPIAVSVATRLVSATPAGAPGAGPSTKPSLNSDGTRVAYTTGAADLVSGATPALTQIAMAKLAPGGVTQALISHTHRATDPGNAPSDNASLSSGGTWIVYDTAATNIPMTAFFGTPTPSERSVAMWLESDQSEWLISDDSDDKPLPGPSTAGMTSPHGNYIVFTNGGQAWLRYLGPK